MLIAVTRPVSASLADCELTCIPREPIDVARAGDQHAAYERALAGLGATVVRAPAAPDLPDAVFVEDTAVVLDEIAILARPGAESRRAECAGVAPLLAQYREVRELRAPATLDGGDVLAIGRTLFVGASSRTNDAGLDQLDRIVAPLGYHVVRVAFRGCLHLKSAVTALAENLVLVNPAWVEASWFRGCDALRVDENEPHAANALRIGDGVLVAAAFPRTLERMRSRGLAVVTTECNELAKAEGAVTCCSLVFEARASGAI